MSRPPASRFPSVAPVLSTVRRDCFSTVHSEDEDTMADKLPGHFQRFSEQHPEVQQAFEELGRATHESGPLSERERRLVKLGIAIGSWTEGGVHSAVRHALWAGCTDDEIAHCVRLAITTVGWPRAQAAMTWVDDVLKDKKNRAGDRKPGGIRAKVTGKKR